MENKFNKNINTKMIKNNKLSLVMLNSNYLLEILIISCEWKTNS